MRKEVKRFCFYLKEFFTDVDVMQFLLGVCFVLTLFVGPLVFSQSVYAIGVAVTIFLFLVYRKYAVYYYFSKEDEEIDSGRIPAVKVSFNEFLDWYSLFPNSFYFGSFNFKDKYINKDKIFFADNGWKIDKTDSEYKQFSHYAVFRKEYEYMYSYDYSYEHLSYPLGAKNAKDKRPFLNVYDDNVYRVTFNFLDYCRYKSFTRRVERRIKSAKERVESDAFIANTIKSRNKCKIEDRLATVNMYQTLLKKVEIEMGKANDEIKKGAAGTIDVMNRLKATAR